MSHVSRGGMFRLGPVVLLALIAALAVWAREVRADGGCKPDGKQCTQDVSCCGRNCMKPAPPPGKARPLFGTCCTPTTTCPNGDNCGTVPDGCGGTVGCGTCTPPDICGGGGVSNQCGCTNGHEVVNGGCFKIDDGSCAGCPCSQCAGSIDGSGNFLCISGFTSSCSTNTDCPTGSACQQLLHKCVTPCG
jgi:hypothetical protein